MPRRKLNESKPKLGIRADWHRGAVPIRDTTTGRVRVRVDSRTEVYCLPGEEAATIAKYQAKSK